MISMNLAVIFFVAKLDCHKNETLNSKKKEYIKEKVSSNQNENSLTIEQVYSL